MVASSSVYSSSRCAFHTHATLGMYSAIKKVSCQVSCTALSVSAHSYMPLQPFCQGEWMPESWLLTLSFSVRIPGTEF